MTQLMCAAQSAFDYWRNGDRTAERLYSLCEHFAETDRVPVGEVVDEAYRFGRKNNYEMPNLAP